MINSGSKTAEDPQAQMAVARAQALVDQLKLRLMQTYDQLMADAKITGMAISIFNDNEPVYDQTFGYKDFPKKYPLTDSTNIYGASFSKAVFGVLVMKLVLKFGNRPIKSLIVCLLLLLLIRIYFVFMVVSSMSDVVE